MAQNVKPRSNQFGLTHLTCNLQSYQNHKIEGNIEELLQSKGNYEKHDNWMQCMILQ